MAERVEIVVTAKDEASKTFNNIKSLAGSIKPIMEGIGLAGIGVAGAFTAINSAIKATADRLDRLDEMRAKTGVSVEMLTSLELAAKQNNIAMNDLAIAIRNMYKSMESASRGTSDASRIYKQLNIDVKDSNGQLKSGNKAFLEIADAISKIENPAERSAISMKVFGRSGTDMLPMLEGGKKALKGYIDEAQRLGLVFTDDDARKAAAYNDVLDAFGSRLIAIRDNLALNVLPPLTAFMELMNGKASGSTERTFLVSGINEFEKQIKEKSESLKRLQEETAAATKNGWVDAGPFSNSEIIVKKEEELRRIYLDQYNLRKRLKELNSSMAGKKDTGGTGNDTGKDSYIRDNELQMEKAHADLIEAQHQRIAKANEAYQRDGLDRDKAYYQALVDAKTKYDKEYADAWEKSHKESIERNAKELKAQQDAQDELLKGFKEAEEKVQRHKEMMQRIYGEMGLAISEATAQAFLEGRDGFKAGARQMLIEMVNFIEKQYLAAELGIAIRALFGGPFAAAELGKVAALVAAGTGLEMLKGSVGSMQSGDTVNQAGTYMLHKNERVLSDVDNRQLVSKLDSIDKRLAGMNTGGNMTVYAMDAQSFQQFMRRTGNSVMQYEVETGRLKI